MKRTLSNAVSELMETHIKLWDIVDMLNCDDDKRLVEATRMDNIYNRRRSDLVEEIDELVIDTLEQQKGEN